MSLLSDPNALPAALLVTYRLLLSEGPSNRNDLIDLLAVPSAGANARETVAAAIREGVGLGIFSQPRPNLVRLADDLPEKATPQLDCFRRLVRTLLFAPAGGGQTDLTRALAWFLSLDSFGPPMRDWEEAERLQGSTLKGKRVIPNDLQWGNFVRWARFLGFLWTVPVAARPDGKSAKEAVFPDPTAAIGDLIHSGTSAETFTLPEFVAWLARKLPVLDGGSVRTQLSDDLASPPDAETGSRSLALAINSLNAAGLLRLEVRSDIGKYRLPRADGGVDTYSHVSINPKAVIA